jgi:hypothetical protein
MRIEYRACPRHKDAVWNTVHKHPDNRTISVYMKGGPDAPCVVCKRPTTQVVSVLWDVTIHASGKALPTFSGIKDGIHTWEAGRANKCIQAVHYLFDVGYRKDGLRVRFEPHSFIGWFIWCERSWKPVVELCIVKGWFVNELISCKVELKEQYLPNGSVGCEVNT